MTQPTLQTQARIDPVDVACKVLRHDHWDVPKAVVHAMLQPRARVAVKACHASGKTFMAADIALVSLLFGGDVLVTAPTWAQVERVFFGQLHRALEDSAIQSWGQVHQTEVTLPTGEFCLGMSTDQAVRFQGFHARAGRFLLVVLDEAPGVIPGIWEAIEGIRSGGDVRVLALGNPTVSSGPFYDAFTGHGSGWLTHTIDAFDTPNFSDETCHGRLLTLEELLGLSDERLDHAPRPYLVSRRWVKEKYLEWGEQSALWQARVRGQFPQQSEDALLSLVWLEAAVRRHIEPLPTHEWHAGIDVAGPGESETVLCVRCGPRIVHLQAWAQPDPRGAVLAALLPLRDRLRSIRVDSIGQGYYFARHIEDNGFRGRVVDVNVADAPQDRERYANAKAEMYWSLRLRAQAGDFAGLADEMTLSQLASIRYRHDARGRVVIESKEEARKRGVRSPDRAEAVMLAYSVENRNQFAAAVGGQRQVVETYRPR